jgi:hypothetical protein
LKDFCDGICHLRAGVELDIPGVGVQKHFGELGFIIADTLAAHYLGGFKEGVGGANRPCRTCEISKSELRSVHIFSDCLLRNESEHQDRLAELAMVSKQAREYWSKQWGINGYSVLSSIPGFEVTKMFLHDPMHDILEGVARYELRAMLTNL